MKEKKNKKQNKTAAINATDIVDKVATDDHCWHLSSKQAKNNNRIKEIKTTKTTRVDNNNSNTVATQALIKVLQEVKANANRQTTDVCMCVCVCAWER